MNGIPVRVLAGILLLTPSGLVAQGSAPVFQHLQGIWRGDGALMGRPARFSLSWQRHEQLAVLTFTNGFADSSGAVTPVLHAAAVYRTTSRTPEAVWLDSRGVRIEIAWEATDSALVAQWTAPSESGRTTYLVRGAETLEVVDEVRTASGWRTFATARYRRDR
jgi:hypothetical protein